MSDPQFWLDEEDGTIWTWGADEPQECDNEELVAELNKLADEVERLRLHGESKSEFARTFREQMERERTQLQNEVERLRASLPTEARGEAAVQKRIERATQPLLDRIDGLRDALVVRHRDYEFLHHAKKDQHGYGDRCLVEMRVREALDGQGGESDG